MNNYTLDVEGFCGHCGKDLSQQNTVKIVNKDVYCSDRCAEGRTKPEKIREENLDYFEGRIDNEQFHETALTKEETEKEYNKEGTVLYGVTGSDGYTRISPYKQDLPRPETIGAKRIVEVEKK